MRSVTSIARILDPNYPTNRAIVGLTALVTLLGAAVQLFRGETILDSAVWAIGAGLAVFFSWVVGRELDPDHELSAFIGAALAIAGLFAFELPSLLPVLWLVLLMRVVNRITGLPATWLDSIAVLGLAGWLSYQGNWGYGVITTLALVLDGHLEPAHRRQFAVAGVCAVITAITAFVGRTLVPPGALQLAAGLQALTVAAIFLPVFLSSKHLETKCDATDEPVRSARVRWAQALALTAGVLTALWMGTQGITALMPLWTGSLGAATYWLYSRVLRGRTG